MKKILLIFFFPILINSQNIDVNNTYDYTFLRNSVLNGTFITNYSLNIRPINSKEFNKFLPQIKSIYSNKKGTLEIKSLGINYFLEFNSHHPYNKNNGTMIPNRGYQHIISPGIFMKAGPLSIKFKPEHHFSQNKTFNGFWEGHYDYHWHKRYQLWNHIDMPERFGNKRHNNTSIGQSSIRLNWKKVSLGLSNENIWWGPSIRNSIMMSNHAKSFTHITLNTIEPIKTFIGNFEWQIISGKLKSSGYNPPNINATYQGSKLWVPKINQNGATDDWRYLQAYIISYSPKWIDGLSLGIIRWVQMYSALVEGKYTWLNGSPTYFPVFSNFFRKNDKYEDYEDQTDQAAGIFFKWIWKDSKAELYFEFHHNDAKQNLRDLILDSDHSRAATIGVQKVFDINKKSFLFSWEWTQMEQSSSRLLRDAGSWYEHRYIYDGYTNNGEVLGSSIGPGSNSQYFSLNKISYDHSIGIALEIIDQDNDFYTEAFSSARDFRRYWKDINFHINFNKNFKYFNIASNFAFIKSLNYQWELNEDTQPYYHPGKDVNNFHFSIKLTYFGNW